MGPLSLLLVGQKDFGDSKSAGAVEKDQVHTTNGDSKSAGSIEKDQVFSNQMANRITMST